MGDISEQLALKDKMNCKSFDWFMKEVAYDVFEKYPRLPPNEYWGELKNEASNLCLDTHGRHPPEKVRIYFIYLAWYYKSKNRQKQMTNFPKAQCINWPKYLAAVRAVAPSFILNFLPV